MSEMESLIPKPVTSRAVQPEIPITVMKEAFLVSNQISGRDFAGEFHAAPNRRDIFQENPFSGLWSFWEHQACRHFPQFGPAGAEGGSQRTGDGCQRGKGRKGN